MKPVWALLALLPRGTTACDSDLNCSLNGLCSRGVCDCDAPWGGEHCQSLELAPGEEGIDSIPLCAYHGDGLNSSSLGASVLRAPEDGMYCRRCQVRTTTHPQCS